MLWSIKRSEAAACSRNEARKDSIIAARDEQVAILSQRVDILTRQYTDHVKSERRKSFWASIRDMLIGGAARSLFP